MTVVYPSSLVLSAYISSAWLDISNYQIGSYTAHWGISRNGPIDFLADTGELKFTLINTDARFSPGSGSVFSSDWKKGCKIKLEITYDGCTRAWYGAIGDFDFDPNNLQNGDNITVTVVDWMDKAAKYPLNYPDILLEQTSDEAVQAILDTMPIQPLEQDFAVGTQSFPVVFDTVTDFTKARAEFQKILLSELCYMYLRHSGSLGEKLVLENADSRLNAVAKTIPVVSDDAGFLLMETGDFLLLETGDKIILDEVQDFESNDDAIYEVGYGDNVINSIQFRFTKRLTNIAEEENATCWNSKTSTGDGTQAIMEEFLHPGEVKDLTVDYGYFNKLGEPSEEQGFFKFRGFQDECLIAKPYPTVFTGLWMSTGNDFTGDISGSLVTSILQCRNNKMDIRLTNNATVLGYLSLRVDVPIGTGRIIKSMDTLTDPIQDTDSIADNDYQPLQWDMTYQIDGTAGTAFANKVLVAEAQPRTVLNRIHYNANRSAYNMNVFMNVDIGDLFPATNVNKGIDSTYFVQDMKFEIAPGGVIDFSLGVKENNFPVSLGSVITGTSSAGTSVTLSYPVAAGLTVLIVQVTLRGSESVSSVIRTHPTGGTNETFTPKSSKSFGGTSADPRVELWYFLSPTPGTSNIIITTSGASFIQAAAMQFYNVDQVAPFGTVVDASGTGGTPLVTVVGEIGDLVLDVIGVATGTITPDSSQTSQWNASSDGAWRGGGSSEAGAASVSMSWTLGGSNKWALLGVAIKRA